MIKLEDGELKDIMPVEFTRQPQVLGISYAIKMAYELFVTYQVQIYVYAFIDGAPEFVLDLLAAELRVRYYSSDFDIETKRDIIKNAMTIALKDGTKFAVERLLQIIYGGGQEIEWYDYNGIPNHFRLEIEAIKTFDFEIILALLDYVKRKTARLDGITMISREHSDIRVGHVQASYHKVKTNCEHIEFQIFDADDPLYYGHIQLVQESVYIGAAPPPVGYYFTKNGQRNIVTDDGAILYRNKGGLI